MRKLISFRIEEVIVNWLARREKETGKNTSDFLREIIWSVYHQELQQKVTRTVTDKFYEEELNSLQGQMKDLSEFLSSPLNQKQVAQMLLGVKVALEQTPLFHSLSLLRGPKRLKKGREKVKNQKSHLRRKGVIKKHD